MNYNNLRLFFIGTALLSYSLNTSAQTQASAAVGAYPSGSQIPKAVFNSLPGVGVYVRDVVFEIKYNVTSYTLKLADDEGNLKQVQCQGSAFSSLAKKYINDYTKPGDIISIESIRAKDGGGREVKLPALLYYIE
jgi:DNA/RNA endonuclease YhcR with UshA esterase domain